MQNRLTTRRRPESGLRQGDTIPAQGDTQQRVPRLPHERDESADSQPAAESSAGRLGAKAHAGNMQGQLDTGKGPVLDAAYDKVKKK